MMEEQDLTHRFLQETGNKISRRALIHGTQHIILQGKSVVESGVIIRGDIVKSAPPAAPSAADAKAKPANAVSIQCGRYVYIHPNVTLHPPTYYRQGHSTPQPLRISDYVTIGEGSVISAGQIGRNVEIGKRCSLGNLCMIKDCTKILDDTVIPAMSQWPGGVVIGGRPARIVGEIGDGWGAVEGGDGGMDKIRWASVGNKR